MQTHVCVHVLNLFRVVVNIVYLDIQIYCIYVKQHQHYSKVWVIVDFCQKSLFEALLNYSRTAL